MKEISKDQAASIELLFRRGLVNLDGAILEKDLIASDAVALVASLSGQIMPYACEAPLEMVFCGGTCLSQAYGMIERISEDVDFKVIVPGSVSRAQQGKALSALKGALLQKMQDSGFSLVPDSLVARNENRYIAAAFAYQSQFDTSFALRPHLQVEITANTQAGTLRERAISPIVSRIAGIASGHPGVTVIGVEETMAEKVISFLRRTAQDRAGLERGAYDDYLVRHLYDVHQIVRSGAVDVSVAAELFSVILLRDQTQFGRQFPAFQADPRGVLAAELETLGRDPAHADRYRRRLAPMVYGEAVAFESAAKTFREVALHFLEIAGQAHRPPVIQKSSEKVRC